MVSDKILLAYAAGVIDGEGSISIKKRRAKTDFGFLHSVALNVGSTSLRLVKLFKSWFGGSIYEMKHSKSMLGKKTFYMWSLESQYDAEQVLKAVRPYLQIKAKQSDVALEFLSGFRLVHGGNYPSGKLPAGEAERRDGLHRKMRFLNGHPIEHPQRLSEEAGVITPETIVQATVN